MKLILIPGSGGCKESFRDQINFFQNAEALDYPGHPHGDLCESIDGYVEWLRGYIQEKGYKDVVICGHSIGGGIALLYALKYPQDLLGIIPIGSGARLRVHPDYLASLAKAVDDPDSFESPPNPLIDPDLAEVMNRRRKENGPAVTLNDLTACDKFDIMDRVSEISVPTLAIVGTDDVMTPPKYTNYMVEKMLNAQMVEISGAGHMVYVEKPDVVNEAMNDFLKGLQN